MDTVELKVKQKKETPGKKKKEQRNKEKVKKKEGGKKCFEIKESFPKTRK